MLGSGSCKAVFSSSTVRADIFLIGVLEIRQGPDKVKYGWICFTDDDWLLKTAAQTDKNFIYEL